MSSRGGNGPPEGVWYGAEDALELLAVLEDARDALIDSRHLTVVLALELQVRQLNGKLGFGDQEGDDAS